MEEKGLDDDLDIDGDDDIIGLLSQDYVVDKHGIPSIEDLDESIIPILAHKDSRNFDKISINRHGLLGKYSICRCSTTRSTG